MSESRLVGHLINEHASHLERVSADNINSLYSCQFCHARFYTDDLVIKHILQHHKEKVITKFQEEGKNKHIVCVFCPYVVLTEQKQCLLAHVEETHFTEFRIFIKQKFTQKLQYIHDTKNSSISNLSTLSVQMSTRENTGTRKVSIYQSEHSSSSQFVNQNVIQLPQENGHLFHGRNISGIKNVTIEVRSYQEKAEV
jgi:hypothetical protein